MDTQKYDRKRLAEDLLAFAGLGQAIFVGILEALTRYGYKLGECKLVHDLPWFNVIILVVCVAPKTLGRATAGKYLSLIPFTRRKDD